MEYEREFNKLVRDNIPEIINQAGLVAHTYKLSENEFKQALCSKLLEEAKEFQQDQSAEELADVLEVIYAIASIYGYTPEQLEEARKAKHYERGGFDRRVFLIKTTTTR